MMDLAVLEPGRRRENHLLLGPPAGISIGFSPFLTPSTSNSTRRVAAVVPTDRIRARISTGSPWVTTLDDGLGRIDGDVLNLLGSQPPDERGDLCALALVHLGDLVEPFRGPIGMPRCAARSVKT